MRALAILGLGLAMPIVLLTMKKERALTAWICFCLGVNIFDARVGVLRPFQRKTQSVRSVPSVRGRRR